MSCDITLSARQQAGVYFRSYCNASSTTNAQTRYPNQLLRTIGQQTV
jgi:hypothetical protein